MMYTYNALVTRVIDGDTCEARIDLGFKVFHVITVRLYGINAPEKKRPTMAEGVRSEEVLRSWIEGKEVQLESKAWDKYGRCVATLTLDGESINLRMIAEGLAAPFTA
jgi:endonuclease YncB( thermonuclease family)